MDNLICKGLKYCLENYKLPATVTNSFFVENYEAIRGGSTVLEIKGSVFFCNDHGMDFNSYNWHVEDSLFLQNNLAMVGYYGNMVRTTFAQNGQGIYSTYYGSNLGLKDVLFYRNDVAFDFTRNVFRGRLQNVTFLDNRLGLKTGGSMGILDKVNFLGLGEYQLHYSGTALYDLDVSLTYWNTSSVDEMEEEIYDALDGSGKGVVQILQAESMPHEPFHHGMYQEDVCAGQCFQHWFNSNWSSLISAGAGTFGFFDPERSLNSGQVLREALLTGHATSGLSLSSYMQDVAGLLEAVAAFQAVALSTTSGSLASTATTTVSTGTQTSTVSQTGPATSNSFATSSDEARSTTTASALAVGDGVNVTTPLTLEANTTWTAGLHTLGSTVTVLPGVTLIIQGNENIPAAAALVQCRSASGCFFLLGHAGNFTSWVG